MHYLIFLILSCGSLGALAYNPKLESDNYFIQKTYKKKTLENFAYKWAEHFDLDKTIVLSQIVQESSWNHKAVSVANAKGLLQLLPTTAVDEGMSEKESLFNPYTNIYYGTKYLRKLLNRYTGDYHLALVAYYSGMKWADFLRDGKLRDGKFKDEITAYAEQVLTRSEHMEVDFGQEVEAEEINVY
jgi:soluble lytic murein transglycosylase-like protein